MPTYEVRVVLSTNIEAPNPEVAKRIALEGAVATFAQDDAAEAEFNRVMPQETYPRFIVGENEVISGDTPNTEDELDNTEEVV